MNLCYCYVDFTFVFFLLLSGQLQSTSRTSQSTNYATKLCWSFSLLTLALVHVVNVRWQNSHSVDRVYSHFTWSYNGWLWSILGADWQTVPSACALLGLLLSRQIHKRCLYENLNVLENNPICSIIIWTIADLHWNENSMEITGFKQKSVG